MFGLFRFYLAVMVVVTHLSAVYGHSGGFAVFSFYALSGYLMTLIMNNKYGYTINGFKKYALNRFLRIFPSYWVIAGITLLGIVFNPDVFFTMHNALRIPDNSYDAIANVTIFGLFPGIAEGNDITMARLVPAAWALHVELCFYLLIGLFLGKSKHLVVLWFSISFVYHIYAVPNQLPRYSPVYAASLPFALGALVYHFQDVFKRTLPTSSISVGGSLLGYFVYVLFAGKIPVATSVFPFYLNLLWTAILIVQLSTLRFSNHPSIKRVDSFLGDLSYPIYLSHWIVAVAVGSVFAISRSVSLFWITLPFLLIFSLLIKYLVDEPIEKTRSSISASLKRK